jgi:hypothetical protein
MSHILLKKVQDNLISSPASNYIKIFSNANDGGLLYYKDSSGTPTPIGDGGGSGTTYNPVIGITYSSLYSLYQSDGFATGSFYYISDFQSIYKQPDFYFDGTLKTSLITKTASFDPIIVLATSKNTLSPDAYQPDYPNDTIKYDIDWRYTETHQDAKGRITERVDENGNRTDYDHRTIKFKRYQTYDKDSLLTGTITDFNCTSGDVTGSGTSFTSLNTGDIIILDTDYISGGDISYPIAFKVRTVTSNSNMVVEHDSLYDSGLPTSVTLDSGSQIIPENYSFGGKNYTFWSANATGDYTSYKEVYFGQSDEGDFDDNISSIYYGASNNRLSHDYSKKYLSGANNTLILSNNVFLSSDTSNNNISGPFYNNTLDIFTNNNIFNQFDDNIISNQFSNNNIDCTRFYNNKISGYFYNNKISGFFRYNIIKSFEENLINSTFDNNILDNNFSLNMIKSELFIDNVFGEDAENNTISANIDNCTFLSGFYYNDVKVRANLVSIDFTSSTIVYANYTKTISCNYSGSINIAYYDATNTLIIDDVDA